jgi:hypothetical protein
LPKLHNGRTVPAKVAQTAITDAGLAHLKGCTELKQLDLDETEVTSAGLKHLKGLLKLAKLHLRDTDVDDSGLEVIGAIPALKDVDLYQTLVTAKGVESMKDAKNGVYVWADPEEKRVPRLRRSTLDALEKFGKVERSNKELSFTVNETATDNDLTVLKSAPELTLASRPGSFARCMIDTIDVVRIRLHERGHAPRNIIDASFSRPDGAGGRTGTRVSRTLAPGPVVGDFRSHGFWLEHGQIVSTPRVH